jgi:D-sedoheptulose 7-phosphate isomerase
MKGLHLDNLICRFPALGACRPQVEGAFQAIRDALRRGGKLLLCGNGGSASDADHWAGELLKGFHSSRPLSEMEQRKLPEELATRLQGAVPAIPLTGFTALSTAFANDVAPELVFAQLVWGLGCSGDLFVGISTSGNARNVCLAAQAARARGLVTLALTGEGGGKLAPLCDLAIRVPARETNLVQEFHLPIYHCLSLMVEEDFFGEEQGTR